MALIDLYSLINLVGLSTVSVWKIMFGTVIIPLDRQGRQEFGCTWSHMYGSANLSSLAQLLIQDKILGVKINHVSYLV